MLCGQRIQLLEIHRLSLQKILNKENVPTYNSWRVPESCRQTVYTDDLLIGKRVLQDGLDILQLNVKAWSSLITHSSILMLVLGTLERLGVDKCHRHPNEWFFKSFWHIKARYYSYDFMFQVLNILSIVEFFPGPPWPPLINLARAVPFGLPCLIAYFT